MQSMAIGNSISSSSPLLRSQGMGLKFQTCKHMLSSSANQPPFLGWGGCQNHLIKYNKRHLYCFHHLENSELCARKEDKDQIYISYYKSQYQLKMKTVMVFIQKLGQKGRF